LIRLAFYTFIISLLFFSCKGNKTEENGRVLAEYKERQLFLNDIPKDILDKFGEGDSTGLLKSFVDKWLENQVMMDIAENSLNDSEKDMNKLIEDYRQSLIIHAYQQKIMEKLADTAVTDAEIDTFYQRNLPSFLLRKNIVKIRYIKLSSQNSSVGKIKQWIQSSDSAKLKQVKELAEKEAENFYLDTNWLYLDDLLKEIPINENYNRQRFLNNNKFIQIEENGMIYLLYILDFRIKNKVSPLELEKDKIKDIILYRRKLDVLKNDRNLQFDKAVKSGDIKYHLEES